MITFLAPALRCLAASSRLVKKPVDSITTSAPTSSQGRFAGSRSANTRSSSPRDTRVGGLDLTGERAQDGVVLEQVGERLVVRDVVDADPGDVLAASVRGPEHVAADAPEAVDSGLQGHPMLLTVAVPCPDESISGAAMRLLDVAVDDVHEHVAAGRVDPR